MSDKIYATAPFNFIPFPEKVLIRYTAAESLPRHDRYYGPESEYGYSGEISYKIEIAEDSALMIGGGRAWKKEEFVCDGQDFFKNSEGNYTIPGNSIRGLIRQNVQILGMGHWKQDIEDTVYLYRDWLSTDKKRRTFYRTALGLKEDPEDAKPWDRPEKLRAGYICQDRKDHYVICPAEKIGEKFFVKISEEKLRPMLGESSKVHYMYTEEICGLRPSELKDKNVISKYRNKNYRPYYCTYVTFNQNQGEISAISADRQQQNRYRGCLFSSGYISGKRAHYLIGDMSRNRAEYLELDAADNAIRLYKLDLSRTKKEKHPFYKLPDQIGFNHRKPIFYIQEKGHIYIGMTPYLRIFYPHSVWDGIPDSQDEEGLDYAEALFGFRKKMKREDGKMHWEAYRSRLSFTDAVSPKAKLGKKTAILPGEPKASCYPEYLAQNPEAEELSSYIDEDFQIRGMKQYWLIQGMRPHGIPKKIGNSRVWRGIRPVQTGSFFGKIYYENLTGDELGLLLYAVKLSENAWQTLGMAKAYGYGKVRFTDIQVKNDNLEKLYSDFFCQGEERYLQASGEPGPWIDLYKTYVKERYEIEIEQEESIRDFLYMKTKIMDQAGTAYQQLGEFKEKRILRRVRDFRTEEELRKTATQEETLL